MPLLEHAAKLGLKTPEINERSVIIVVEVRDATVGLLVDSVSNIIAPSDEDMRPPPTTVTGGENSCVSALSLIDEKLIRILDLSALLPTSESVLAEAS